MRLRERERDGSRKSYRRFEGKREMHRERKNDDHVVGRAHGKMTSCISRLKLEVNAHRPNPFATPENTKTKPKKMRDMGSQNGRGGRR
jgi:hypothetical protein